MLLLYSKHLLTAAYIKSFFIFVYMIPEEQLTEIKTYLEKAECPLFFFDDDNDGLCSYVLFRQFTGKGYGVPIKAHPALDITLLNKVEEHRPDYIFVLDKPLITQEFIDRVSVPVIWLDHHPLVHLNHVLYFNPKKQHPDEVSSTTYWAYKIVGGKLWIAVLGAVSDWTIPDYFHEFEKQYPDLTNGKSTAPDLLFNSRFGELCRMFSFLTKGRTGDVKKRIKHILNVQEPYEVLDKTTKEGTYLFEESEKINLVYRDLLKKALSTPLQGNLLVFTYPQSDISLTADLSNELLYKNPGKVILVGREKEGNIHMSLRSDSVAVNTILERILPYVDGYGGGHTYAVGASVKITDFALFVEHLQKEISRQ